MVPRSIRPVTPVSVVYNILSLDQKLDGINDVTYWNRNATYTKKITKLRISELRLRRRDDCNINNTRYTNPHIYLTVRSPAVNIPYTPPAVTLQNTVFRRRSLFMCFWCDFILIVHF